jgi:predicted O-methyltransferase YrrM
MNHVLRTIFDTQCVIAEDGRTLSLQANLPEIEGEILQHWVRQIQPRCILEIGMAFGISSLFLCDAIANWDNVTYHIVDPFQSSAWSNIGRLNLARAGFADRFNLIEARSEISLPRLLDEGVRIDFAFVDGNHRFEHVMVDSFYLNKMLNVGGAIVFDDVDRPGVAKALAFLRTLPHYEELPLPESIAGRREMRIRRMMNVPQSRITAFRKVRTDGRPPHWYVEF